MPPTSYFIFKSAICKSPQKTHENLGVATFCKDSATPFAAEEGLTGRLVNHGEAVGCYGDQGDFSIDEIQSLDNEGRAVITQHKFKHSVEAEGLETLTVINVYCPRADPEKPERKQFKLQFYKLLQSRAEAILGPQSHVIVLGDINTSHQPIDHCDPDDVENFEENPGRKWLDSFLFGPAEKGNGDEGSESSHTCLCSGNFIDTFRHFHPSRINAFTCWSTRTGARQTNYGTRIDYIFANRLLVEKNLLNADIMPEVEGSDHCPIWAKLSCVMVPSPRCPPLCTCFMPEFMGKQQKLFRFLVKVSDQHTVSRDIENLLPGSQEAGEICENLSPLPGGGASGSKRPSDRSTESSEFKGKKIKHAKKATKPQGSLLTFFKPKPTQVSSSQNLGSAENTGLNSDTVMSKIQKDADDVNSSSATHSMLTECQAEVKERSEICLFGVKMAKEDDECGQIQIQSNDTSIQETKKGSRPDFWKSVLHGPPQPPMCNSHNEPCVLRTVKKPGTNLGRQFFVCARPQGHTSNPQARCNFFAWVDKRK
ncbi:DNA-(apurinic or apyrimidinic site) endonuclease 2 isoform 2-T2 [Clarias gariepinus]|uniref:DNA-(apurinic or apyrimidinic site) lyase 2 isoform X2 n=1 Tax=Clarias gariepinus TaxID=13013 RepID=UPI00234D030E|nr:DNA-(apurinic or apyrimidinic site) lyase 2 isoform X2 [Clarias gariepinus]